MSELKKFGKADILILSHVFEHLPDLHQALEEIKNLIHSKSIIYIEVPGVKDLINKDEYLYDYQDYTVIAHTYNFSLTTLRNVLSSVGFECLYGDEFVRAIFRSSAKDSDFINDHDNIIQSLNTLYLKYLEKINTNKFLFFNYCKNLIKAIINKK